MASLLVSDQQILEVKVFARQDSLDIHCLLAYLAVELEVVEVAGSPHFLSDVNQDEILIGYQLFVLLGVIFQDVE